ncbi:Rv3235 family protein [Plantactinospora siamensis]|uniref:Rv3235 family protein n=1 Tax=Plantactinospora siamensis TaxID=555372 RepID=A0ABV6NU10_9ACTN
MAEVVEMAPARTTTRTRAAVRVRPVPPLDPPFEDESLPYAWWREPPGQLALDLGAAGRNAGPRPGAGRPRNTASGQRVGAAGHRGATAASAGTPPPAGAVSVRGAGAGVTTSLAPAPATAGGPAAAGGTPGTGGSPGAGTMGASQEARRAARHVLGSCLEILDGHRPIGHVRRLCAPTAVLTLTDCLTAATRRLAHPANPSGRRYAPLRIRAVRVCEPAPGVAEVAAVLGRGDRSWAMALRLERRAGRWLSATIDLL